MATEGEATFLTAELEMVGGTPLAVAPLYPEIAWLGDPMTAVAAAFESAADKRWSRKGQLLEWLEAVGGVDVVAERIEVVFPESKELFQPELQLHFDALLSERIGLVPALGIGAWADGAEAVRAAVEANIKLEFARNKRLRSGREILATQWYTSARHSQEPVSATFYTFSELRAFAEAKQEKLVPKLASELKIRRQHTFAVDEQVGEIRRLRSSRSCSNLLLVGASGVGKTAIFEEFFRQEKKTVWETTASRMERALTTDGGWQPNLTAVCKELQKSGDWLFVRNLAELFEVGRYVGNNTSIGEYLRPFLASGEISLLTECTDGQRAHIDARYPGFLALFRELKITEPEPQRLEEIIVKRAAITGKGRVNIEAVREVLRLQRRFTPYSGFPGKTIRFLEHLVRATDGPINRSDAVARFCEETGIPPVMIDREIELPIEEIRRHFASRVYGQPAAVDAVVDTLVSVKAATTRGGKPIASLLFVGPTGVGKTETAKALANFMFGDDRLIRFDMSEFSSPGSVMRLAGGTGEGLLTAAVRRQPFSVLLFDEIEKADSSFFDLLLQVLGEGRLTDGRGRVADFCSAIVVMTSNIGATGAAVKRTGFGREASASDIARAYEDAVKAWFRPEFFNRIDRVLPFSPLSQSSIRQILDLKVDGLRGRAGFQSRRVSLDLSEDACEFLAEVGYLPAYGARQLQRALTDRVLAPVSGLLNERVGSEALTVSVGTEAGALSFKAEENADDLETTNAKVAVAELAELATEARRLGWKVAYGASFAELRSAWAILDRRRIRLRDDFWRNDADARRHGRLGDVIEGLSAVLAEIDTFEEEVNLAAILGRHGDAADHRAKHEAIEHRRLVMFRKLYEILHEDENPLCMGIYGSPERVAQHAEIYTSIAENIGFEVDRRAVWLLRHPEGTFDSLIAGEKSAAKHVKQVGIELRIRGAGAALAFLSERGLMAERHPKGEDRLRLVTASCTYEKFPRPDDVHRKSAYNVGRVMRVFTPEKVEDKTWKRGVDRALYAEKLEERLRGHFWRRLLEEVSS